MPKAKSETPPQQEKQTVVIKLNKYKSVVDALGNQRTAMRVAFTIFFIGVLLFAGITIITLAVKRLYPYSDIKTNGLGATTIKSEKSEVSYWLYNTATVWADSGIYVKEGDILTIRASGKSNTAIHHLYESAKRNVDRKDDWVGSEGEPDKLEKPSEIANYYRRRFRIFPNMDSGALLMQVAQGNNYYDTPREGDPNNFYFIGRERQNIIINKSGTLRFAVNDIVMNRNTIARMMWDSVVKKGAEDPTVNSRIDVISQRYKKNYSLADSTILMQQLWGGKDDEYDQQRLQLMVVDIFNDVFQKEIQDKTLNIGKMHLGRTDLPGPPAQTLCELTYYFGNTDTENERRKYVWFEDNIGSFLIIIEKTN